MEKNNPKKHRNSSGKILILGYFTLCILIIGLTLILNLTGIEFSKARYENSFEIFRFYAIPVCIFLGILGTLRKKDNLGMRTIKIVSSLIVSGIVFVIMIFSMFVSMCEWTDHKILFINRHNSKIKIIERDFGCGATDSSPAIIDTFKVRELNKYLRYVSKIEQNEIGQENWVSGKP